MNIKSKISVLSLIFANLYPIFGVMFLNWNLSNILVLYWSENIVIGFYNVLKMVKAQENIKQGITVNISGHLSVDRSKLGSILFFILHYGLFTFAHGVIVFTVFATNFHADIALYIGILSLFVSHGFSYVSNYIGRKEFEHLSPEDLFGAPYVRVVIMHLTVLFGGVLIINFKGQSLGPLIVLTVVKTVIDIFSHYLEHNKLIPTINEPKSTKIYHINSGLVKMFFPNYEKNLADMYRKSVEIGKWDEIKSQMDPETVAYIENYWFKNHGIVGHKD